MSKKHPIIEGLIILSKYDANGEFSANWERIWYGKYDPEKVSKDDLKELAKLGWHERDRCWSHRC